MSARNHSRLKNASQAIFILNLVSTVFGIFYALFPSYTLIWDIFGWVILVTIFGDILLVYLIDKGIDKASPRGRKLNRGSYVFLFLISMAMLGMMLGNFLVSVTYVTQTQELWGRYAFVFGSYFGLLGGGMLFSYASARYYGGARQAQAASEIVPAKSGSSRGFWRALRIILILSDSVLLAWGVYFCAITLAGAELGVGSEFHVWGVFAGFMGVFVPMWGIFWAIIMLSTALFLVKLTRYRHNTKLAWGIGIVGLVVTGILLTPPITTLAYTSEADTAFADAFGADWHSKINATTEAFFLPTRFVLPGYFLGISPKDCVVIPDVIFYEGTTGKDTGIVLKFDAYLPPNNGEGLPGRNSTLIRIHGGGWVMGDKGMGDMLQMNEYFAAQGYCVFDIQYGLNNYSNMFLGNMGILTPEALLGNFTVEDQVRHIGLFCQNLTANQAKYGANLSSVFVSGGSAGGHLTCATALAIASNNYTTLFGTGLTVKGYVPFYPGNGMADFLGYAPPELVNPALLVNESSPPCLDFHGTEDGLVYPGISQTLKDAYTAHDNDACAVLWMPFSGHAGDLYFSGYYNQFFLYYMERFIYLFR